MGGFICAEMWNHLQDTIFSEKVWLRTGHGISLRGGSRDRPLGLPAERRGGGLGCWGPVQIYISLYVLGFFQNHGMCLFSNFKNICFYFFLKNFHSLLPLCPANVPLMLNRLSCPRLTKIKTLVRASSNFFTFSFPFPVSGYPPQPPPRPGLFFFNFLKKIYLFFDLGGSSSLHGTKLWWVGATLHCGVGFSLRWLLLWSTGSGACGLQWLQHLSSVVVVHGLSCSWHMESSWTRDRTDIQCITRQILSHWTMRDVQDQTNLFMLNPQPLSPPHSYHWCLHSPESPKS